MRTEQEVEERIERARKQIKDLTEMLGNRSSNRFDENLYQVMYGYQDEIQLLKWVLKQDQNDNEDNQS